MNDMSDGPEVFTVFAQVTGPKGTHPGVVCEGAYVLEDGAVVTFLTEADPRHADRQRAKVVIPIQ